MVSPACIKSYRIFVHISRGMCVIPADKVFTPLTNSSFHMTKASGGNLSIGAMANNFLRRSLAPCRCISETVEEEGIMPFKYIPCSLSRGKGILKTCNGAFRPNTWLVIFSLSLFSAVSQGSMTFSNGGINFALPFHCIGTS